MLVCDIDGNEVCVLGVVHFDHLLLVGVLCLGLVVARFGLFAASLELLAGSVVLALGLAKVVVGGIALSSEVIGKVGMALSQLFEPRSVVLERLGDLGNEMATEGVVFSSSGFESRQLGRPGRDRGTV